MSKKERNVLVTDENEWIEEEFASKPKSNVPVGGAGVQLAPIVQPIAFVPYNTQEQPLLQYGNSGYDLARARDDIARGYDDDYDDEYATPALASYEKKVRFVPIFLAILSLLIVGVMVAGEFVLKEYLVLTTGVSGYGYIMNLVDMVMAGGTLVIADMILPGAIALIALFAVLNLLASLIKMKSKGACTISKICLFFMLTFSLVVVLICLMNEIEMGYGLYAVAGLSFLSLVIGYLAKKDIKKK